MVLSPVNAGTTLAGVVPHSCVYCKDIVLDCTGTVSEELDKDLNFRCKKVRRAASDGCALFQWCWNARLKSSEVLPRPNSKLRINFHSQVLSKLSYANFAWIEDGESAFETRSLPFFTIFTTSGINPFLYGCAIEKSNLRQTIQPLSTSNQGLSVKIQRQKAHLNSFLTASGSVINITLIVPNQGVQSRTVGCPLDLLMLALKVLMILASR
jgi:hypothetical protein